MVGGRKACMLALERNSDADLSGFEHILSLDSYDFSLLDSCKLTFFLGEVIRAWEIEFDNVPGFERGR